MSRDFTNLHEVHNFLRTYEFVECLFFLIKTLESEDSREGEKTNTKTTAGIVFYAVKNGLVV